jgi:hypothetical protein
MVKYGWILFSVFVLLISCKKKDTEDSTVATLKEHNMKIIPEEPTSKDEVLLVVLNDCEYNKLTQNKRTGKTINVEKQFNSAMKLPCVQKNDTISIGKLPAGDYKVNYSLFDIATSTLTPTETFSFDLSVSK